MKPLRWAVIGVGHLGRIHARLAKQTAEAELVAVVDPSESQRRQVCEELNVPGFGDIQSLAGRIDAAIVAAPTRLHHAIGLELLSQGVHLLIEKPLAMSLAEANDLVQAARRGGALLQVGHIERFNPAFIAALPHLRDVKFVEASRLCGFSGRSSDVGVVLDLMIHDIDLVLSVVRSPVVRVDAMGIALLGRQEDAAHARLEFENGCVATLCASRVSNRPARTMHAWTPAGYVAMDLAGRQASRIVPCRELLERKLDVAAMSPEETLRLKEEIFSRWLRQEQLETTQQDQITAEQHDFLDSIRTGRSPRVNGDQAREAIAVAEQVLESIEHHAWDGRTAGRIGPQVHPAPSIIPAPHFDRVPQREPQRRREAG